MELIAFVAAALIAGADPNLKNCELIEDDKIQCEVIKDEYIFGEVELKIVDPVKLLREAHKEQANRLRRTDLWRYYSYPPFIEELARQNNIKPQEMIDRLSVQPITPNPWAALKQLELTYEAAVRAYGRPVVDEAFSKIMDDIIKDVLDQIKLSLGTSHV